MVTESNNIKLLCNYGGKILPRNPDGKLRYFGGETRLISVDRSISFSELVIKLNELCNSPVSVRCQLPEEDLDALVSITSDEDLKNIIEEYDLASKLSGSPLKIKAFLWPVKQIKKVSPPPSMAGPRRSRIAPTVQPPVVAVDRFVRPVPVGYPVRYETPRMKMCYYTGAPQGNPRPSSRPVHNGNYWQYPLIS